MQYINFKKTSCIYFINFLNFISFVTILMTFVTLRNASALFVAGDNQERAHQQGTLLEKEKNSEKKTVRILTIDGGEGIIPARILSNLEERTRQNVSDLFDFIVGTSTGGFSALYLTVPNRWNEAKYTAKNLVDFFEQKSELIYSSSYWHQISTAWGYRGPLFSSDQKKAVFEETFGKCLFSETRCKVMVPTRDLDRDDNLILKNVEAKKDNSKDYSVSDLAMAVTATPTHFSPERIESMSGEMNSLMDAGSIVNNPTMLAISQAKKLFPEAENLVVVSLGTGEEVRNVRYKGYEKTGYLGWQNSMVPLTSRGTSDLVDEQAKVMLGSGQNHYYRIQTRLNTEDIKVGQADPDFMHTLKLRAEATIKDNDEIFQGMVKKLVRPLNVEEDILIP